MTDWKTSQKAWETQDQTGYLIGYFPNPKVALKVKRKIEAEHGIQVAADIRLVGIVDKNKEKTKI